MEYMTVLQASEKWGISDRRVRILCQQEKIPNVIKQGRAYFIPADAEKPDDGRCTRYKRNNSSHEALFAEVDALKKELDNRRPLTQGELQRLREEFLIEYTYNSNAIEGNTLTLQETALVLEGITIDKKPLKDHLEAVGHRDAFLYVLELVRNKTPISEFVIKQIHTLVLMDRPEDRGVYRRIPVRIMGAFHEPADPVLISEQMEKFVKDYLTNKTMHPIEKAALFHLLFEGIHPFVDGNGRTDRLILNLMLMQSGYPPVNIKYSDRKRYYEAFDAFYRDENRIIMVEIIILEISNRMRQHLALLTGTK